MQRQGNENRHGQSLRGAVGRGRKGEIRKALAILDGLSLKATRQGEPVGLSHEALTYHVLGIP